MIPTVKARIRFLPLNEGGRKVPVGGPRYATVVHFEEDTQWPNVAWTLVAEFLQPLDQTLSVLADIRFLVEEAPHHLLKPGAKFQLLEAGVVAEGVVVATDSAS